MIWIKSNPTIVSESEINPNLYFNASNLKDGVKERTDMTEVDDYLMNKAGIHGPQKNLTRTDPPEMIKDFPVPVLCWVRESLEQGKLSTENKAPLFARMYKPFILSKTV